MQRLVAAWLFAIANVLIVVMCIVLGELVRCWIKRNPGPVQYARLSPAIYVDPLETGAAETALDFRDVDVAHGAHALHDGGLNYITGRVGAEESPT